MIWKPKGNKILEFSTVLLVFICISLMTSYRIASEMEIRKWREFRKLLDKQKKNVLRYY